MQPNSIPSSSNTHLANAPDKSNPTYKPPAQTIIYVLSTGALTKTLFPRICTANPTAILTLGGTSSFCAAAPCCKLC
jgi:hypothetical protein